MYDPPFRAVHSHSPYTAHALEANQLCLKQLEAARKGMEHDPAACAIIDEHITRLKEGNPPVA